MGDNMLYNRDYIFNFNVELYSKYIMNPGQFNKRIQFLKNISTKNEFGGTQYITEPCTNVSEGTDTSVTWGSLEPYRQYKQLVETAGVSELDGAIVLKIRFRDSFYPDKSMTFRDISDPNEIDPVIYSIQAILPYYPGAKQSFQSTTDVVFKNKNFVWVVGIKTDNSYINLVS